MVALDAKGEIHTENPLKILAKSSRLYVLDVLVSV